MTRNMIKRVEILFPVEDNDIAKRLLDYMNLQLSDNQRDVIKINMVNITILKRYVTFKFTSLFNAKAIKYGKQLKSSRPSLQEFRRF